MTIAEKITRAKADIDAVYEAGYAKGQAEGGGSGYEEGLRAAWNGIEANGTRTNFGYAYRYWGDPNAFGLANDIKPNSVANMFEGAKIGDLKGVLESLGRKIDFADAANLYFLATNSTITRFPAIVAPKTTSSNRAFFYTPVVSIDLLGVSTTAECGFTQAFDGCTELVEIRFVAPFIPTSLDMKSCKKLSKASFGSLVNALHPDIGGSITVSQTAVNKAFETSEGANDGLTSPEWLAIRATKENWEIKYA